MPIYVSPSIWKINHGKSPNNDLKTSLYLERCLRFRPNSASSGRSVEIKREEGGCLENRRPSKKTREFLHHSKDFGALPNMEQTTSYQSVTHIAFSVTHHPLLCYTLFVIVSFSESGRGSLGLEELIPFASRTSF